MKGLYVQTLVIDAGEQGSLYMHVYTCVCTCMCVYEYAHTGICACVHITCTCFSVCMHVHAQDGLSPVFLTLRKAVFNTGNKCHRKL